MALRVLDTAKLSPVFVVLVVFFFYWSWQQNAKDNPEIQHHYNRAVEKQRQLISEAVNKPTASPGGEAESNLT